MSEFDDREIEVFPEKPLYLKKYDLLLFTMKVEIFIVPFDSTLFPRKDLAVLDWAKNRIYIRKTNPELMHLALWHELMHAGLYFLGHETLWRRETLIQNLALLIKSLLDANPELPTFPEWEDKLCEK